MSATEPRYCPVSTLLSTCAALPSYAVGAAVYLGTAQCPRLQVITRVTSHVLQVDGAAHVISDDRHDVRLLTGVKGVIRRRQPSVVGRVVAAVTVVAVRRPRQRSVVEGRPGGKRPTMPERPVTKAAPKTMPASVAPAATEMTSATAAAPRRPPGLQGGKAHGQCPVPGDQVDHGSPQDPHDDQAEGGGERGRTGRV